MTPAKLDILLSEKLSVVEESDEKKEIRKKIKELEEQLLNVKGCKCLVYSRIVGYMSPTINWNPGKLAEWGERQVFEMNKNNGVKNNI